LISRACTNSSHWLTYQQRPPMVDASTKIASEEQP
jgi:hypothetical protein